MRCFKGRYKAFGFLLIITHIKEGVSRPISLCSPTPKIFLF